ncbi:hypothetical protein BDV96DRAFT_682112 [Lophiotrema nucula]|uniref:Uncharacterized protein n=1 Tax=Lophiotrema nucula TaxID=690887 RepID=A0A6A5ZV44_9PLEO|nr:hypothetical protein BDV96DRAFT_682112 [Lophiotrema nucula]
MSKNVQELDSTATGGSTYTNLHLATLAFVYPPNPPTVITCPCEAQPVPQPRDQEKHIRVYHNEPSGYGYNSGRFHIKESRFSTSKGWCAPIDDLVADDAAAGSPVATVGWWEKVGSDDQSVFQTRVYYVASDGKIRERTNRSYFDQIAAKDDFDAEMPKPDELVPPAPGWKLTPVGGIKRQAGSDAPSFPKVVPLTTTKLAAVRSEDGSIHIIYQANDESIRELVFSFGKGWIGPDSETDVILETGTAKPGTPLTAVAGGWSEKRVLCVTKTNQLLEVYSDDNTKWFASTTPYTLQPSAMISAVASNFASPFFELRIYTATDNDDLHELSFNRTRGGWGPAHQGISSVEPEALPEVKAPLSAVAAVLVPGEWVTKVYFHPRRIVIAEWDICAKEAAHAGITRLSAGAKARRAIEEQTRVKITLEIKRREEERKKKEGEERKKKEEEERKREAERVKKDYKSVKVGGKFTITDQAKLKKVQARSGCEAGYEFEKIKGGWRCTGGAHTISDADFEAA